MEVSQSDFSKTCGCSSYRSCLNCEVGKSAMPYNSIKNISNPTFYGLCVWCNEIFKMEAFECDLVFMSCEQHCDRDRLNVKGVCVVPEFISEEEEREIVESIDGKPWKQSQSGRRKQDYGPSANFKKQKIKIGRFTGFPYWMKKLLDKFSKMDLCSDFVCVELCNLEYRNAFGSAIEPHIDDEWLWGERLITLNYLSDTFLTLLPNNFRQMKATPVIRIPLLRRSALVLFAESRYQWQHAVFREDISDRRVASTLRELGKPVLNSPSFSSLNSLLFDIALKFDGEPC